MSIGLISFICVFFLFVFVQQNARTVIVAVREFISKKIEWPVQNIHRWKPCLIHIWDPKPLTNCKKIKNKNTTETVLEAFELWKRIIFAVQGSNGSPLLKDTTHKKCVSFWGFHPWTIKLWKCRGSKIFFQPSKKYKVWLQMSVLNGYCKTVDVSSLLSVYDQHLNWWPLSSRV